jgi:hypothetical protein
MNHDVGGQPIAQPIERAQHAFAPWEVRVDAMMMLLTDPTREGGPLMTVDELRRGVEALSAQDYARLGYYQRWLRSLIACMVERGAFERDELEKRVAALVHEHALEHAAPHHS